MKELEAKILEIDVKETETRLTALGAVVSFDAGMHAIYYDLPDGSLTATETTLRLRKEGDKSILAVKKKDRNAPAGIKIAEELETETSDFAMTNQMLLKLGYQVILEMQKHRKQFELGNAHIVIDQYEGAHGFIPAFLEIEAPDTASLYQVAELLGYNDRDCVSWNSAELLAHYSRKH